MNPSQYGGHESKNAVSMSSARVTRLPGRAVMTSPPSRPSPSPQAIPPRITARSIGSVCHISAPIGIW
jgi:hypothetical protein